MNLFIEMYPLILTICIFGNAAFLSLKVVDLTHVFNNNTQGYPITKSSPQPFQLTVSTYYPNGQKVSSEEYAGSTRAGTHIDSPSHFYPGTASIDQLSLDKLIGPAAVIDISSRALSDPDTEMTVEDLKNWERSTGHSLNGTIVLMKSGWSKLYGNKTAYFGTTDVDDSRKLHFPGFSPEAAKWLVENRAVRGTGVDTLSLDRGMSIEYLSHKILSKKGIYILENVANLEKIPRYGATLYVMPMKIARTSGAPVRIIATYPEVTF